MEDISTNTEQITDAVDSTTSEGQEPVDKTSKSSDNGALSAENSESQQDIEGALNESQEEVKQEIDYSKMTDAEYADKLEKVDGFNRDEFAKMYGKFCRDEKLSPELVSKYIKMEKARIDETNAENKKAREAEAKAFQEEGVELRKKYNPQQINTAIQGLKSLGADEKFMGYATKELSNNPTLVKLLINWRETHSEDNGAGITGAESSREKTFEEVWTGR